MQKRNHPEQDIQKAIVDRIGYAYKNLYVFHVPNGGYRKYTEAQTLKAQGVKAGVGDLCILWHPGRVGFIEVKSAKGAQTPDQALFQKLCERLAVPYAVVKSQDEAVVALKAWGAI